MEINSVIDRESEVADLYAGRADIYGNLCQRPGVKLSQPRNLVNQSSYSNRSTEKE